MCQLSGTVFGTFDEHVSALWYGIWHVRYLARSPNMCQLSGTVFGTFEIYQKVKQQLSL
jgi:hypothetical protein